MMLNYCDVNMYKFFGGVTRILGPDNLRTGMVKASWSSLVINKVYQEMAEHYGTAVSSQLVLRGTIPIDSF
ncbi:hypothetical protein SDC9_128572 [bioreactor metagenome]|uniref:Uncharacterized protein n=1 Tax=bioreactor metagenome TaxID=1076179 RepID=A0A645CX81_9ZZZZ